MIWNAVAAFARLMSLRRERQGDVFKDKAWEANRAAEWWSDVQAWADGLGTWRSLRHARERRLRPPARVSLNGC